MNKSEYIQDILNGLGLAINEKSNSEIIINYPINFVKKTMNFKIDLNHKMIFQPLGTFLVDFINVDFNDYASFLEFFIKYNLSLIDINKIKKIFNNYTCSEQDFRKFIMNYLNKNSNKLIKLQEQIDMILDYCLLSPSKKALEFTPIERLYVLRRFSCDLTLLHSNKDIYYNIHLFSSFPGNSENEIYKFLKSKKNKVTEEDWIIPFDISGIINKSIVSILSGKVYLKNCKNCNRYFIAKNKSSEYCNNIVNGTKKTCHEIGRLKVFNNMKNNDVALSLYYKVYSRKSMMKSRNPDIIQYAEEFNNFKTLGKKKLEKYKQGDLSSIDFIKWIKKHS